MTQDFFEAIRAGDRDRVERFLLLDPGLIHARENGLSPVLAAAYQLEPDLADFLAEKTAAINLFEAAATGKTMHLVRLLARHPEQINAFADDGFQPLGLACFFGHLEAAEYLLKAGASINTPSSNALNVTPLHSAVAGQSPAIVRLLLKKGANPNVRERGGFTPLHTAAANGDLESIQLLILGGADLRARSQDGKLPLDLAVEKEHRQAAEILKRGITKRFRATASNP